MYHKTQPGAWIPDALSSHTPSPTPEPSRPLSSLVWQKKGIFSAEDHTFLKKLNQCPGNYANGVNFYLDCKYSHFPVHMLIEMKTTDGREGAKLQSLLLSLPGAGLWAPCLPG
jgi:hypothetical protein